MRDEQILSHSATFQTETSARRLAPFAAVLVMLLGTVALGMATRAPMQDTTAQAEHVALAQATR
jgi:hypothetical protein